MKCEARVGGSRDNDSPHWERRPGGPDTQLKAGITTHLTANVDQASEQDKKKTPQPNAKCGTTAEAPPPLQQLGGETGGQQQQAWRSLDQNGDYPTQSKHGQ